MARQGPLKLRSWAARACLLVAGGHAGAAQPAEAPKPPLGVRPYSIRAQVQFDPTTRVDATAQAILFDEWQALIRRFVGDPWQVEATEASPTIAAVPIEALDAARIKPIGAGVDKVWAIQAHQPGPVIVLEGREYDTLTGRLGEAHRVEVRDRVDLPRGLLTLARSLFEPLAEVGESRGGGVTFQVQGGAIDPANPAGVVAPVGSVFRAFRLFLDKDGAATEIRDIPYSYFRVEERTGATARCSIIKGVGDPLTSRFARRNRIVALGLQPARATTRLRFLLKGDKSPAAGYKLLARAAEADSKPYEVGITDRDGRIDLPPDFAPGLAIVRVIAGNDEPMADLPVMPGETRDERSVVFEGRPRTLDLEARLDALRDLIIDTVASRSRLEARMKARIDGEDFPGFEEALAEFRKLPGRDTVQTQFDRLRGDAEQAESATKTLILTRNARNLLDETQALINRYLEDDLIRGMVEAVATAKTDRAAEAKAKSKTKKSK